MKKTVLAFIVYLSAFATRAQKVDSIYFNLYTDSLKKGAMHFNYINVDGKLSNGSYVPLDSTQVRFTASVGRFSGNVLTLDSALANEFVIISATLIADPAVRKEIKVYIKKVLTEEPLKTSEELIEGWQKNNKKKN